MIFKQTPLKGAFEVTPEPRTDERGYFFRYYCEDEFAQHGIGKNWVQFNQSFTATPGSTRGMHYQLPPFAETKFLRCIAGKVFDVIVDLRSDSETFLQWYGTELSKENRKMLYIPEGFAHGFQTLEADCELLYHHSAFYTPGAEGGLKYDDPLLNIQWPLQVTQVSERDNTHPLLNKSFSGIKI